MSAIRRSRRLKPDWQGLLYHARQPVFTLLSGSLIALAINFSLAQVNQQNSPAPEIQTLDKFDIHTDESLKEVRVTLHRGDKDPKAIQVSPLKRGSQLTLTLNNTQLSQEMVDNGLPVVIDNQNKLIGRAVPGKIVTESKIIIPNMPSEQYRVVVYEQSPGKKAILVAQLGDSKTNATLASSLANTPSQNKASAQPASPFLPGAPFIAVETVTVSSSSPKAPNSLAQPPKPVIRQRINKPSSAITIAKSIPLATPANDTPQLRLDKVSYIPVKAKPEPKPRAAVDGLESQFEQIVSNVQAILIPVNNRIPVQPTPQKAVAMAGETAPKNRTIRLEAPPNVIPQREAIAIANASAEQTVSETLALASVASQKHNAVNTTSTAKRPIQVVESHQLSNSNKEQPRPAVQSRIQTAQPQSSGSITYIPPLSSLSGTKTRISSSSPLWNPYVIHQETTATAQQPTEKNLQQAVPENALNTVSIGETNHRDPLWYLHQLPGGNGTTPAQNQNNIPSAIALQSLPDLTGSTALPSNPGIKPITLSPAPTAIAANGSSSIQIDNGLVQSIHAALQQLPLWFYIVFGLFFGGIGLFATLGSLVLFQQIWDHLRKPAFIHTAVYANQAGPDKPLLNKHPMTSTNESRASRLVGQTRTHYDPAYAMNLFADSTHINPNHYIGLDETHHSEQKAVKQAVKKSMLLHFPSHRAGRQKQYASRTSNKLS